jgi:hypothetical protein
MRQAKALWDIAGEAGLPSSVVGWWATWPAEKMRGGMVTDHAFLKLADLIDRWQGGDASPAWDPSVAQELEAETYPSYLLLELAPYLDSPDETEVPMGLPASLFASDRLYAEAAVHLMDKNNPYLSLLYLPGPDVIKRVLSRGRPETWRDDFERALPRYFDFLSEPLARILATVDTTSLRAILLLPGWEEEAEDGWLILDGPGVRRGSITQARYQLADAAATLIYMSGLPLAEDLPGYPVTEVLDEGFTQEYPPAEVASYGLRPASKHPTRQTRLDREMLDRLRSLGYIGS